jgi:hypothetical protein
VVVQTSGDGINLKVYYCTYPDCGVAMVEGGRKLCDHSLEGYKLRHYLEQDNTKERG